MAQRKVVWTRTASMQRRNILEYWVDRTKSNAYSLKLLKASNSKTKLIARNPKLFREADFPETRALQWDTSVFFTRLTRKSLLSLHSGITGMILRSYYKN